MKTKFGRQMTYFVWQPLAGLVDIQRKEIQTGMFRQNDEDSD